MRPRTCITFDGVEYVPGAQYRVVRDGAHLTGRQAAAEGSTSWRQGLEVGDVIECDGFGPDWGSDPGFSVQWRSPEATHVEVLPSTGGVWDSRPAPGYLQPLAATDAVCPECRGSISAGSDPADSQADGNDHPLDTAVDEPPC